MATLQDYLPHSIHCLGYIELSQTVLLLVTIVDNFERFRLNLVHNNRMVQKLQEIKQKSWNIRIKHFILHAVKV